MRQIISIFLLTLLILACNKQINTIDNYNFFYFTSDTLDSYRADCELTDSLENGTFRFYDKDKLLTEGQFEYGFKVGEWNYYHVDTFSINWKVYQDEIKHTKISYPNYLEVKAEPNYLFFAKYNGKDSVSKNDYFIVLQHSVDSIEMNLNQYAKYYYDEMNNNLQIKSFIGYLIESGKQDYLYFEYDLFDKVKEKEIMLLCFLTSKDNKILDFSYASTYNFEMQNKTVFFQMLTSCFFNGERIFSPFEKLSKTKIEIEDLNNIGQKE